MLKRIFALFLLLMAVAGADGLDGRTVLLVVSEHREGDPAVKNIERGLLVHRNNLGLSKEEMPIIFMGFLDSDTERTYFDRLGFTAKDAPIICVAEWGNPARFGPKRVKGAIARSASDFDVTRLVDSFLHETGRDHLRLRSVGGELVFPDPKQTGNPPPNTPPPTDAAGKLDIVNLRFEATGSPVFLTNAAVRLHNPGGATLRDISVRFYVMPDETEDWLLISEDKMDKLPAGYFATRDFVGDTRKIHILDENERSRPCRYKVEVEQGGQTISEEGEFVPAEAGL